jgi:hypothetical protein
MLWFTLNNVLAAVTALFVTDVTHRGRHPLHKGLAAVAMFPVVTLLAILLAGALGRLGNLTIAIILASCLAALSVLRWRSGGGARTGVSVGPAFDRRRWVTLAIAAVVTFGAVLALARFVLPGTAFGWDDFSYHAPIPAYWLLEQGLAMPPATPAAHYPLNAEAFSLWFMLPFHSDAYAWLAGYFWLGLGLYAVVTVGIVARRGVLTAPLVAVLLFGSPLVANAVRTFSAADVAGPAMFVAALVMLLQFEPRSARQYYADVFFAAVFAGYALGCKIMFAPACLVLFCWIVIGPGIALTPTRRVGIAALFVAGISVCASFWYLRNVVLTGNPLFPAEALFWDGPWSSAYLTSKKLSTWIVASPTDWRQWRFLVSGYTDWPLQFFAASLAGYFGALYLVARAKPAGDADRAFLLLLLLTGGALAATFPFLPFSGANAGAGSGLKADPRFLIGPYLIGLLLLSDVAARARGGAAWLAILALLVLLPLDIAADKFMVNVAAMCAAVGFVFAARYVDRARVGMWCARSVMLVVLSAACLALSLAEPALHRRTADAMTQSIRSGHSGKAWAYLERLPGGAKVAQLGYNGYEYYPLFGRDLQHVPIWVDENGTAVGPLHRAWREDPDDLRALYDGLARSHFDRAAYIDNLLDTGVEYVVVRRYPGQAGWFERREILGASRRAVRVYADGQNEIYRLDRVPAAS